MRRSQDRISTSHVGSLPRPDALIEANRARDAGETADQSAFEATLSASVMDVVRHQRELGIDVPGDGEFGKSMAQRVNYGSWWRYSWQRLAGIEAGEQKLYEMEPQHSRPGAIVPSVARANVDPIVGCPAIGSSSPGVKMRMRTSVAAAGGGSGGKMNVHSEKFISRVIVCISAVDSPAGSGNTAS